MDSPAESVRVLIDIYIYICILYLKYQILCVGLFLKYTMTQLSTLTSKKKHVSVQETCGTDVSADQWNRPLCDLDLGYQVRSLTKNQGHITVAKLRHIK